MKVNLNKPNTHRDKKPTDLFGQLVRVRPYYQVPSRGHSLTPARSPFTFEGWVEEKLFGQMVIVRFTWETDSAPWRRTGAYHPRELHRAYGQCECPACAPMGDGIPHPRGA